MVPSRSSGYFHGFSLDGYIGTINFFPSPLSFILSFSSEMDTFIFRPYGRPTNGRKDFVPSFGSIISKSICI